MSTQGYERNKINALYPYSIGNDKGGEKKNKKKKWEKEKAISQCGYGVDDTEEWSVECGGTIIGLGATTKKWMVDGELDSHTLSILRIKQGMRE